MVWDLLFIISTWSKKISHRRYACMIWIEFTSKQSVCEHYSGGLRQTTVFKQPISQCDFLSLPDSPFLSSNLWFPNYPHLYHVCSKGSGNWVMLLHCATMEKHSRERKVVCFCTTLFNALLFLKLTVCSYAKHRIVWVCITLFSITLEVTSSSHMHTKSQNFTPHICPVISQTKYGCWLSLYFLIQKKMLNSNWFCSAS